MSLLHLPVPGMVGVGDMVGWCLC